jgi:hypothetical protein
MAAPRGRIIRRTKGLWKSQSARRQNESSDLNEREYRDEKGEIHHHTRTFEEQHSSGSGEKESGRPQTRAAGSSQEGQSSDLKEREYRDEQGNIHHPTHTAKEQQK